VPAPAASPAIQLSLDGVTYGAPGVKLAYAAGATVYARLDSVANVDICTWAIAYADGYRTTPSDYTLTTTGIVGNEVSYPLPAATEGIATILQSTVNDGVGPDGNTNLLVTQGTIKAHVLASNGLEVGACGENYESDPVNGTGSLVNEAIALAGVLGGGVTTSRQINTTAPLTGGGDLSANRTLAISAATDSTAGSMSGTDKAKLDGATAAPTAGDLALRDASGGLVAAYFATAAAAVAAAGALKMPAGAQVVSAIKGATHATVALESVTNAGATLQIGDGVEITAIDLVGGAAQVTLSPNGWTNVPGLTTSTTNATPKVIGSFALATGFDVILDFTLKARATSGIGSGTSFTMRGMVVVENPTGTPAKSTGTTTPAPPALFSCDETSGALTVSGVLAGLLSFGANTVTLSVVGLTSTNIDWVLWIEALVVPE
jgi:hypothetical protein